MLFLFFVAMWFILRGDLFYVFSCVILVLCFSALLALRLLRFATLCAYRNFVRFALIWFCLLSLPLCVLEGPRFVIVALPGLLYYLFFFSSLYSETIVIALIKSTESVTTDQS